MSRGKYITIIAIILTLIFPEYVFTGLGAVLLVIVIIFFVVDIVFDIYILIVFFVQWIKDR